MNTPCPCDTCTFAYYNCINEDDLGAECTLELAMGNEDCPCYEYWNQDDK